MTQAMLIDDDEDYRNLLVRKLSRAYQDLIVHEIDPNTMELPGEDYPWEEIDFIILDYQLGLDITGLDWFKRFRPEQMPATILLTARGSEEIAVRAIKLGIDDYLVKEHFDNEILSDAINECIYTKKQERARAQDLTQQSIVFNKPNFIKKLQLITGDHDADFHLLLFNPQSYQQVGMDKGITAQDACIKHIADRIYRYLASHRVDCNIYLYKEEYIAVILETKSVKKLLNDLYKKLEKETTLIGSRQYSCSVSVGVISPRSLEPGEFSKNDFELLSIARFLCDSANSLKGKKICNYGDVNIVDADFIDEDGTGSNALRSFDIEKAIDDGRVSANYQPWVYISTDETVNLRDIYDVRIEVIDTRGNKFSQQELLDVLDNAFAKRMVDRWVLRNSVPQLSDIPRESGKQGSIKLAVKLTLSTVADPEFIDWLESLFRQAPLPSGCLLIEVEAGQFLRDPGQYRLLMEELGRPYGIKFVLSGIGQINIYYQVRDLQRFDYVKLNVKDLIYGFPRHPLYELIESISEDGSKIVAVNVDDAEMLTMATEFDIDYVHGYLVGRPDIDVIADSDGDLHCVI